MRIGERDRKERELMHLQEELERERFGLSCMEDIRLMNVTIIRNKKVMYMAEVEQAIRRIKDELEQIGMGAGA